MLYNLIQTRRGKQTIVMTGELAKVNNRMKTLRASHRKGIKGDRVTYTVETTEVTEKFKQKPHNLRLSGDSQRGPRKVKWD